MLAGNGDVMFVLRTTMFTKLERTFTKLELINVDSSKITFNNSHLNVTPLRMICDLEFSLCRYFILLCSGHKDVPKNVHSEGRLFNKIWYLDSQ